MSLAADLHPSIPLRWNGQRLEPDLAAMRRPVAEALGTACAEMAAPEDMPPPESRIATYPDLAAAIAALRARDWAAPPGEAPHPGVDAARLTACLIYAGHAAEARRLLRELPAGRRLRPCRDRAPARGTPRLQPLRRRRPRREPACCALHDRPLPAPRAG